MLPIRDLNPTRSVPYLTYGLIGLNLIAFLLEGWLSWSGVRGLSQVYGLVPARLVAEPWEAWPSLFSSMFMHASVSHLVGNLLFLSIFGDNIEDALGRVRFALFYLLSGLGAGFAQVLIDPASTIPMVGASGAISGILGAYLVLFPRSRVLILNTVPPLWLIFGFTFYAPAWLVLGFWFLVQNLMPALGQLAGAGGSNIAFFAHLGGFIVGLMWIRPLMIGRNIQPVEIWDGWRRGARPLARAPQVQRPFGDVRSAPPGPATSEPESSRVVRVIVQPRRPFDGRWGD